MNSDVRDARREQEQLDALHHLDEECVHLQRAGNYLQAFDRMERALVLRHHFFGADSAEVVHACRALAEMCNLLSMSFLQRDNYAVALELLKKAEILSQRHPKEKATTLNNLACYYRRLGKLHTAMTCLNKALAIEKKTLSDARNAADTHLNICAVLSQLGKHPQALEHAQAALVTLQEEFFAQRTNDSVSVTTGAESAPAGSAHLERMSVMCIAYHNMGVEQEYLKDYEACALSYKTGVGLAEQYLGVDHAITTTLRNSYLAAKRTISTKAGGARHPTRGAGGHKAVPLSPRASTFRSSLRLPSPVAKSQPHQQQYGQTLPSPRSIVADALSRGNTLPPLETPSLAKEKVAALSPEDPFFSPRFRFDADEGFVKKVASALSFHPAERMTFSTDLPTQLLEPINPELCEEKTHARLEAFDAPVHEPSIQVLSSEANNSLHQSVVESDGSSVEVVELALASAVDDVEQRATPLGHQQTDGDLQVADDDEHAESNGGEENKANDSVESEDPTSDASFPSAEPPDLDPPFTPDEHFVESSATHALVLQDHDDQLVEAHDQPTGSAVSARREEGASDDQPLHPPAIDVRGLDDCDHHHQDLESFNRINEERGKANDGAAVEILPMESTPVETATACASELAHLVAEEGGIETLPQESAPVEASAEPSLQTAEDESATNVILLEAEADAGGGSSHSDHEAESNILIDSPEGVEADTGLVIQHSPHGESDPTTYEELVAPVTEQNWPEEGAAVEGAVQWLPTEQC